MTSSTPEPRHVIPGDQHTALRSAAVRLSADFEGNFGVETHRTVPDVLL